jgi:predicted dehydrogenase
VLSTLILGFGNSGRALHLRSLLHAHRLCKGEPVFATSPIVAVDPAMYAKARARADGSVVLVRSLDQVEGIEPADTVAHVCTPPATRVAVLRQLSARGYRRIVCEKPVAGSVEDLHEVLKIVEEEELDVAVVSPWLSSTLTLALSEAIDLATLGRLKTIEIEQLKPRFTRTRDKVDHPTAFEIEVPHSMGVALHLGGTQAEVVSAGSSDMVLDGVAYPHLGRASVELKHRGGVSTVIDCDLTAPVRKRSIELTFERGTVLGHYPVGDDTYAQLQVMPEDGPARERELLLDDQLAKMMVDWYTHYADLGPRPVSDLRFNVLVTDTIAAAKRAAGIEQAGRIVDEPLAEVPG